jgi:LmbE family N-acetylglucosaminyl deacetylase
MTVLVVAAHPDDEVLGCGGTVARHAAEGETVHVLIVAEGATARQDGTPEGVKTLRKAAEAAARVLGTETPAFLGLPDNRLDGLDRLDIIQAIEEVIGRVGPDTVYTHHGGDLNIDHRIVHEAVVTACRPLPGTVVRRLYCFETVSSTEWATSSIGTPFVPNHFVGVEAFMATKLAALDCYASEMRPFPHARSVEAIESLAALRGAQSGLAAAEAFACVRDLRP